MDPKGENEYFYADDIVYYVINNNAGYEGDLELALIPEEFLTDILHEELDSNGVLVENANSIFERFALLFEFTGDKRAVRHVLYCCSASRPSVEGETMEDEKEVQTEELSIIASALASGLVKVKTSVKTSKAVYDPSTTRCISRPSFPMRMTTRMIPMTTELPAAIPVPMIMVLTPGLVTVAQMTKAPTAEDKHHGGDERFPAFLHEF